MRSSASRINRKFSCVANVPPKPLVVAPYGTWSRRDWAVERITAMHCAPARAAASAWRTSSWMFPVATIA